MIGELTFPWDYKLFKWMRAFLYVKTLATPISSTCTLDKYDKGKAVDETKYRGMIGSIL